MKLIYEKSVPGRGTAYIPQPETGLSSLDFAPRQKALRLPELSESQVDRHYTELAKETRGVNGGFYPLGSCTMKYNPAVLETVHQRLLCGGLAAGIYRDPSASAGRERPGLP